MKKINAFQQRVLFYIHEAGGSYCPGDEIPAESINDLNYLVKTKRLRIEETDAAPRYHLTKQGRDDATS